LKARGTIRQIGPVFDTRSLGYQSTLVAMRVLESHLDRAAKVINEHPGISHAYEREHHLNLWLTLSIPPGGDLGGEVRYLSSSTGAETCFSLPALKVFKIGAYFGVDTDCEAFSPPGAGCNHQRVALSARDRLIINKLQRDLPLISHPYADMASELKMDENDFLAYCHSLLDRGIMRRFAAAINHRRAGFVANAMVCWIAPPEKVLMAGFRMASLREVSHCYEREVNPLWPYNLFTMIHGMTREECLRIVHKASSENGLSEYVALFSTREFKKTRLKYQV
jgi:DNA-binding Lrp family transcriptional regulator